MDKKIYFSDYVEILTTDFETVTYSPVYSDIFGIYLKDDSKKKIKLITLIGSKFTVYYCDSEDNKLESEILSVQVDDRRFKRRMNISILGSLFKYDKEAAMLYNLDMTKAVEYNLMESKPIKKVRQRSN